MGAAYYIVLEKKIKGLETGMDGKNLSRHINSLDQAARQLGVRPLSEFFSPDPGELAEIMADAGMDADEAELPALEQFTAQEGLATVSALLTHRSAQAGDLAQDLRDCERILSAAAEHGVGWHFEIDI